jgi:hypothetical protein
MMTRSLPLVLLGFALVVCSGLACTSKPVEPLVPSAQGYIISLRVSDTNLGLGPRHLGDPRPNTAELIVEVRDMQGHRVEEVPVAFHVAPSWVQSATILPQHTVTYEGTARAVFEPHTIGVAYIMVQVNGQTQKTAIRVGPRNFGNSGGR